MTTRDKKSGRDSFKISSCKHEVPAKVLNKTVDTHLGELRTRISLICPECSARWENTEYRYQNPNHGAGFGSPKDTKIHRFDENTIPSFTPLTDEQCGALLSMPMSPIEVARHIYALGQRHVPIIVLPPKEKK